VTTSTTPTESGSVQLISKVASILDALALRPDVTVGELCDAVGEPRSSLYRLLQSLQTHGYVEPGTKRGTYRLGLKLLALGDAVAESFDVRQSALPVLERLNAETGETVFLCIRRDDDAVCIERLAGRRVQSLALRIGGTLPLHAGAASRALLAFEDRSEWMAYWERRSTASGLPGLTPFTPVTKSAFVTALEQTLDAQLAVSDQDVTIGIAALGAPIFDRTGKPCAALSVSGIRESLLNSSYESTARSIKDGAGEVSWAMGYRPAE
jgi:DNA-binding IclR family transcriptional regulator